MGGRGRAGGLTDDGFLWGPYMTAKKKSRARGGFRRPTQRPRELPLRNHAERALSDYFTSLNGHRPAHLYDLVLREVEEPLFRVVLDYAEGNQSRAAGILGINRGTLRKKLKQFGLGGLERSRAPRIHSRMLLPVRRALLSVSDKTGLLELARGLAERNVEILSTGGTARLLAARASPCAKSPATRDFPKSWMGASKRCIRRFTADCSGAAGWTTR